MIPKQGEVLIKLNSLFNYNPSILVIIRSREELWAFSNNRTISWCKCVNLPRLYHTKTYWATPDARPRCLIIRQLGAVAFGRLVIPCWKFCQKKCLRLWTLNNLGDVRVGISSQHCHNTCHCWSHCGLWLSA